MTMVLVVIDLILAAIVLVLVLATTPWQRFRPFLAFVLVVGLFATLLSLDHSPPPPVDLQQVTRRLDDITKLVQPVGKIGEDVAKLNGPVTTLGRDLADVKDALGEKGQLRTDINSIKDSIGPGGAIQKSLDANHTLLLQIKSTIDNLKPSPPPGPKPTPGMVTTTTVPPLLNVTFRRYNPYGKPGQAVIDVASTDTRIQRVRGGDVAFCAAGAPFGVANSDKCQRPPDNAECPGHDYLCPECPKTNGRCEFRVALSLYATVPERFRGPAAPFFCANFALDVIDTDGKEQRVIARMPLLPPGGTEVPPDGSCATPQSPDNQAAGK